MKGISLNIHNSKVADGRGWKFIRNIKLTSKYYFDIKDNMWTVLAPPTHTPKYIIYFRVLK